MRETENPRANPRRQAKGRALPAGPGEGTAYRGIVRTVLLLHPVPAERVIIKSGVFNQSDPLLPARRHVGPVVLIEVFSEESWKGTGVRGVREQPDLALASQNDVDKHDCSQPETNTPPALWQEGEPRAPSHRDLHVQDKTDSRITGKSQGLLKYGYRSTKIMYSR